MTLGSPILRHGPMIPTPVYLLHFQSPHRATDVDNEQDVFGQGVQLLGGKVVDEITIKDLQN